MLDLIRIKKGLDLNLIGEADGKVSQPTGISGEYAIIPDDFYGLIPKLLKKEGETVLSGEAVLYDKNHPEVVVTSPVSGTIKKIIRGERRKILAVVIEAGSEPQTAKTFKTDAGSAEQVKTTLLESGLWALMRQRPYGIIPDKDVTPRDIFVTTFDSAPLTPDHCLMMDGNEANFKKGLSILAKLTNGNVYIGVTPNHPYETKSATSVMFEGPHPAGNVGTQIAHIAPVNKGETVWALDAETVIRIGKLFTEGKVDYSCIVTIAGEKVKAPQNVKTTMGISLKTLLGNNIDGNNTRIIAGNVLTGVQEQLEGFLHFPYRQITAIPEISNDCEFMGWASLSPKKYSASRTFFSWLMPKSKKYSFDAKINGGERAIIMAGEYDKVFPMDIYAEYLIKAIIARDIDKMEQLGIYEVVPEDFALCEFIDTSKIELQRIVKEGLDYLRKETN